MKLSGPRRSTRPAWPSAAVIVAVVLVSARARAVDPFEIQVYDGTANRAGEFGAELHANFVASGLPARPPLLATDHVTHLTLEPSYGLRPWWELGGYLQAAIRPDGRLDYGGVKLRSKFVTPPGWHSHLRLGVNLELSVLPRTYDPDRVGAEVRPIAAWEDDAWLFAINPIVDVPFAGAGAKHGPEFEPAAMALRKVANVVSLGFEYYAGLGPFSSFEPVRDEQHALYEAVNLLCVPRLELNFGVGEGLTRASDHLVLKTIVGYSF